MTWWQRLWRRTKMEEQLEKELRFHLDQHASELIARGHSLNEAGVCGCRPVDTHSR